MPGGGSMAAPKMEAVRNTPWWWKCRTQEPVERFNCAIAEREHRIRGVSHNQCPKGLHSLIA